MSGEKPLIDPNGLIEDVDDAREVAEDESILRDQLKEGVQKKIAQMNLERSDSGYFERRAETSAIMDQFEAAQISGLRDVTRAEEHQLVMVDHFIIKDAMCELFVAVLRSDKERVSVAIANLKQIFFTRLRHVEAFHWAKNGAEHINREFGTGETPPTVANQNQQDMVPLASDLLKLKVPLHHYKSSGEEPETEEMHLSIRSVIKLMYSFRDAVNNFRAQVAGPDEMSYAVGFLVSDSIYKLQKAVSDKDEPMIQMMLTNLHNIIQTFPDQGIFSKEDQIIEQLLREAGGYVENPDIAADLRNRNREAYQFAVNRIKDALNRKLPPYVFERNEKGEWVSAES